MLLTDIGFVVVDIYLSWGSLSLPVKVNVYRRKPIRCWEMLYTVIQTTSFAFRIGRLYEHNAFHYV